MFILNDFCLSHSPKNGLKRGFFTECTLSTTRSALFLLPRVHSVYLVLCTRWRRCPAEPEIAFRQECEISLHSMRSFRRAPFHLRGKRGRQSFPWHPGPARMGASFEKQSLASIRGCTFVLTAHSSALQHFNMVPVHDKLLIRWFQAHGIHCTLFSVYSFACRE